MAELFYTYIWRDARGIPFYVGKGLGRRAYVTANRSAEFLAIHSKGGCTVEIIDEFIIESQAHANEMELIAKYGRREYGGMLVNKTDGGEGMSGFVRSAESIERSVAAHRGVRRSPEVVEKTAKHNRGRKPSEVARRNMSAAARGKPKSPSHRAKIGASQVGKTRSSDYLLTRAGMGPLPANSSGFKGVSLRADSGVYRAYINVNGMRKNLGSYELPAEAAKAVDAASIEAWGNDCYLNFPAEEGAAV